MSIQESAAVKAARGVSVALTAFTVMLLLSGCGPSSTPPGPSGTQQPPSQPKEKPSETSDKGVAGKEKEPGDGQDAQAITAEDLTAEFVEDHEAAGKKYRNKWLIIEGVLKDPPDHRSNSLVVNLKGTKLPNSDLTETVGCDFGLYPSKPTPVTEKVEKLTVGQKVKIKGQFSISYTGTHYTLVDDCKLVD